MTNIQIKPGEVKAKFEQTEQKLRADFGVSNDPAVQQIKDDDEQLKNVGDSRVIKQQGKIVAPDGETVIPVELTFVRTRNKNGGVDVNCIVPALGLMPQGGI